MQRRYFCVGILALGIVAQSAPAIVTSDQPGSHVVAPGQPAFGLNLDGVVIVGGVLFGEPISNCTGALISDSHVVCAAHCFDEDADGQLESPFAPFLRDSVVFQLASGQVAIEYEIDAVQVPDIWPEQEADIAVITLTQKAPREVPRYPLHGSAKEVGSIAVLTGYGATGHGSTGIAAGFDALPTRRAGLNRIEDVRTDIPGVEYLVADFDNGLASNNALAIFGLESDLGFGADEVSTATGDSGGPLFIGSAIAGVNAFGARLPIADVNGNSDSSWGEGTFFTRVGSYRNFILTATGGTAVFVPEPTAIVLLIMGAAGLAVATVARRLLNGPRCCDCGLPTTKQSRISLDR